jgi:MSHA biogenesis protein MshK
VLRMGSLLVWCLAFAALVRADVADPTRPPGVGARTVATLPHGPRLTSILVSDSRRLAVVNGRTVREGELVGQAKVKHIDISGVVLEDETGETYLSLRGARVTRHNREDGKHR